MKSIKKNTLVNCRKVQTNLHHTVGLQFQNFQSQKIVSYKILSKVKNLIQVMEQSSGTRRLKNQELRYLESYSRVRMVSASLLDRNPQRYDLSQQNKDQVAVSELAPTYATK